MADDDTTSGSDGFDDWLEDEPGPPTDPYASLKDDDPGEEIADWVAFTEGRDGGRDDATIGPDESTDLTELPTAEMDVSELPTPDEVDGDGEGDETAELDVPDVTAVTDTGFAPDRDEPDDGDETAELDVASFDGGGFEGAEEDEVPEPDAPADEETNTGGGVDDDVGTTPAPVEEDSETTEDDITDELPGIPPPTVFDVDAMDEEDTPVTVEEASDEPVDAAGEPDDTGELDIIPIAPYGGFTDQTPDDAGAPIEGETAAAAPSRPDFFDMSEDDYLGTATREHTDLAEAIALAEEDDTEPVAIAAPIPGLAESVVGFEDVVEAEGMKKARSRKSGDLVARVITGIVLVVALGASLVWQPALVALALAVFVIGAGEFYTSLVRSDRKPVALFGFIGIIGASLGAYFWGPVAIPTGFFIAATLLLLFYAVVPGKRDPMGNLALTITVMVWAGLGAFAMPIIASPSYRPLVVGVVIAVAAMDIAQYFFGRMLGRTQLAPWVSPKKTVEGLVAGVIVALAMGAALSFVEPFELTSGMLLGILVAILAPLGDLAMSAAKRSLGIKDMGSVLPGHGGFLDRIDGLLFVIPAAWAAFLWVGLL